MTSVIAEQTALLTFYEARRQDTPAIAPHLPRLRELAEGCLVAAEFGVKRGGSSSALLLAADRVISCDLNATRQALELKRIVGDRWDYRLEDSRQTILPEVDLLFVDSFHTFQQVFDELTAHADHVRRYLVFHDVLTFGSVGAKDETGAQSWTYQPGQSVPEQYLGIRPAIDLLMIRDRSWRVAASYTDAHGLLVLERS